LTSGQPLLGWALVLGVLAIAGMPPFGVFMSEFLVITSTFARQPLLAIPLIAGLLVGFGALIMKLQGLAFGATEGSTEKASGVALIPFYVHLSLVLLAGIYLPGPLVAWFQSVAKLLG
jgi:hydrogenase-4 component F